MDRVLDSEYDDMDSLNEWRSSVYEMKIRRAKDKG